MSNLIDRWPKLTVTLAVLCIAAAGYFLITRSFNANKRPKGNIWFYNLKTHQLFPTSDMSVPPIDTKSGPGTGVRAYVFICDANSKPTNFIAFLETFTPEVKRQVEEEMKRGGGQSTIGFALESRKNGILVSSLEEERWFLKLSNEGSQIMEAGKAKGGCPHPKPSLP